MLLTIVIPVFNEMEAFPAFYSQLCDVLGKLEWKVEILIIDDGSTDETPKIINHIATSDDRVKKISLSRNFGHQAALTAGLDNALGDVIITMDGDGQHPPSIIHKMLELHQLGYEIVLAQRSEEQPGSLFKRRTASLFYWLINRIGNTRIQPGVSDFRLMSRQSLEALKSMREYHRFLRGMVSWIGFETVILPYTPAPRLAGISKYSTKKMLKLATDAIFSFSQTPIQIGVVLGLLFLILALAEMAYVLSFWITNNTDKLVRGWSSLMFIILIGNGTIMLLLGLIGLFIAYIYQEVKQRPIYIIKNTKPDGQEKDQE